MIRVFLLDDHEVVRRGLVDLLEAGGDLIALMARHIPAAGETDEDLSRSVRDFGPYAEAEQDQ